MTTVKVGADLNLELKAMRFLSKNDPEDVERVEAERLYEMNIIEVPLEKISRKKIDVIGVLESMIDEELACWHLDLWEKTDHEVFLTIK